MGNDHQASHRNLGTSTFIRPDQSAGRRRAKGADCGWRRVTRDKRQTRSMRTSARLPDPAPSDWAGRRRRTSRGRLHQPKRRIDAHDLQPAETDRRRRVASEVRFPRLGLPRRLPGMARCVCGRTTGKASRLPRSGWRFNRPSGSLLCFAGRRCIGHRSISSNPYGVSD